MNTTEDDDNKPTVKEIIFIDESQDTEATQRMAEVMDVAFHEATSPIHPRPEDVARQTEELNLTPQQVEFSKDKASSYTPSSPFTQSLNLKQGFEFDTEQDQEAVSKYAPSFEDAAALRDFLSYNHNDTFRKYSNAAAHEPTPYFIQRHGLMPKKRMIPTVVGRPVDPLNPEAASSEAALQWFIRLSDKKFAEVLFMLCSRFPVEIAELLLIFPTNSNEFLTSIKHAELGAYRASKDKHMARRHMGMKFIRKEWFDIIAKCLHDNLHSSAMSNPYSYALAAKYIGRSILMYEVATHLSNLCRWAGMMEDSFSVCTHSLVCYYIAKHNLKNFPLEINVERRVLLMVLTHDAGEGFGLGDRLSFLSDDNDIATVAEKCTLAKFWNSMGLGVYEQLPTIEDFLFLKHCDEQALGIEADEVMPHDCRALHEEIGLCFSTRPTLNDLYPEDANASRFSFPGTDIKGIRASFARDLYIGTLISILEMPTTP